MPEAAAVLRSDPAGPPRSDPALRAVPDPAPPTPRLELPAYDLNAALELSAKLGISHVLAQVLVRRGMRDAPGPGRCWRPRESHDPSAFAGIDRAVEAIRLHIAAGSRIVVHGDYDVDGVCATASWSGRCARSGPNVAGSCPSRIEDGYGLSLATVAAARRARDRLLITVDCGITAVEEVRPRARQGSTWSSPITTRRAPTASCPTARSSIPRVRLPVPGSVRDRRRVQAGPGARGAEAPRRTSSSWRWRRSPT